MKKLIICLLFLVFCAFNNVMAEEITMPTDDEIRQTIEKFNFDEAQKEFLFKETKKKLEQMYKNGEINSEGFEGEINPDYEKTNSETKSSTKTKKYSNHEPLTKKQKYGPQR